VTRMHRGTFAKYWQEIAWSCLKLGATAYGGLAITGIIQSELQEKRQWVSQARFLEGIALIQLLPGAGLVQLSTFLGYARGGWWGGVLAGLCFALPGFAIMLALTMAYATFGATPTMRAGLDGLGPVVRRVFMVAVYRLGRASATTIPKLILAILAAAALALSPLGIVSILALAAAIGIGLFHSRRLGAVVFMVLATLLAVMHLTPWFPSVPLARMAPHALPDPFAVAVLMGTLLALLTWRIGAVNLMMAGAGLGILRSRLCALPGLRGTLRHICVDAGG
jgi:chromate transport protein ChrA